MLADTAPDIVTYRADPDAGTWHGREGFMEALADWTEGFEDWALTFEELFELNASQVLVRVHQRAVGAESRAPIEGEFWFLYTFRGSQIARQDMFTRREAAMEAADR